MSELQLRAVVADRPLDVEFSVSAGEVLAVLGPNGAGKSTALHVIAGLVRPDEGVVRLGDRVLTDTAAGVDVATHDRRVGLLLQDPLLFPHLSVAANVAFGPHSRRGMFAPRAPRTRQTALRWLREVDAEQFADRKPRQLSGGQAQRVAIARALAAEPDVLLLDEPLSRARRRRGRGHPRGAAHRGHPQRLRGHPDHPRPAGRVHPGRSGAGARVGQDRRNRPGAPTCSPRRAAISGPASPASTWSTAPSARTARCAPRSGVHWHASPAPERRSARRRAGRDRGVRADGGGRLPGRAARQPAQLRRGDRGGAGHPRIRGPGARPGAARRRPGPGRARSPSTPPRSCG